MPTTTSPIVLLAVLLLLLPSVGGSPGLGLSRTEYLYAIPVWTWEGRLSPPSPSYLQNACRNVLQGGAEGVGEGGSVVVAVSAPSFWTSSLRESETGAEATTTVPFGGGDESSP